MAETARAISPIVLTTNYNSIKYNLDGTIKKTHSNKHTGVSSEVYAFRTQEEISKMIAVFDSHIKKAPDPSKRQIAARNKMMFLIGINLGIRASDIAVLQWNYFFENKDNELVFRDKYVIQPKKQKKYHKFVKLYFNDGVKQAIKEYVDQYPIEDLDNYLFTSQKGGKVIQERTIWNIVKQAALEAGIKQNIGSHSLRKTFGYWVWHSAEDKNQALCILREIFSHSNVAVTAKYIGITDGEIKEAYESISLGCNW